MTRVLVYGAAGGALIAVLRFVEYQYFVRTYPGEVYGAVVAIVFCAVGVYVGLRWTRARERVVVKEVPAPAERLRALGITPREHEVLTLIAQGLSNREIGEKLFVSENTVKTHSSRLFEKLGARRRVQAVQRGRELGLIG